MRWRRKNVQEGGGGAIIACVIVGENLYCPAVWNKKRAGCFILLYGSVKGCR